MSGAMVDQFGGTITVSSADGMDIYVRGGITIEAQTGTNPEQALATFNAMLPDGYVPPPPPVPTTISALNFIRRFTAAERLALVAADPVWGVMIAAAGEIDITSNELLTDLQSAVSAGLLTQARMAQIVNLVVVSP